jgi:hypothetical protein
VVSFSVRKEIEVAQARLSVRKIREILRLRAEGFSEREIVRSVGVARSSIQICLWRAERAGVGWPPPAEQDDAALEALLYPRPKPGVEVLPTPDFEWIERELRRKHVTRRQLWREYLARYPDGLKYAAFCVKFRQWRWRRGVTMSLTHLPGDRLFVDYAGDPAFYTDPTTGIVQKAWIFVAVWPYSGLIYAEATRTQTSIDWLTTARFHLFFDSASRCHSNRDGQIVATQPGERETVDVPVLCGKYSRAFFYY